MLFMVDSRAKPTGHQSPDCGRVDAAVELCSVDADGNPDGKHRLHVGASVLMTATVESKAGTGCYFEVAFVPVTKKVTFEKPTQQRSSLEEVLTRVAR